MNKNTNYCVLLDEVVKGSYEWKYCDMIKKATVESTSAYACTQPEKKYNWIVFSTSRDCFVGIFNKIYVIPDVDEHELLMDRIKNGAKELAKKI
jgi:hypothetical protein